jgi:bifunctional DNA-binding transcriptional regulator/antitoxin component of YhaV-PrlF toxin-antitoxin module
MGRRKVEDRAIRSLTKISNGKSYTVTLPIEVIRRWRWKNRQKLEITVDEKNRRIIIEDWTP